MTAMSRTSDSTTAAGAYELRGDSPISEAESEGEEGVVTLVNHRTLDGRSWLGPTSAVHGDRAGAMKAELASLPSNQLLPGPRDEYRRMSALFSNEGDTLAMRPMGGLIGITEDGSPQHPIAESHPEARLPYDPRPAGIYQNYRAPTTVQLQPEGYTHPLFVAQAQSGASVINNPTYAAPPVQPAVYAVPAPAPAFTPAPPYLNYNPEEDTHL
jgi:hypothetical protein